MTTPTLTDWNRVWSVTARDINLNEVEIANPYLRLSMRLNDSDVGEWTLRMMSNHPAVAHLMQPGSGIVVRPSDHSEVVMSGWTDEIFLTESRDSEIGFVTFTGFDDNVLLSDLAYPNPALDVSDRKMTTFAATHDVKTGPAEEALKEYVAENIGPTAAIVRRRVSYLNIPANTGLGEVGTWQARFDNLLELCRSIATYGGLSFRVKQSAQGEVSLYVWEPELRESVKFSVEAQNMTSAVLIYRSPSVTDVVVGGEGEGAAREFARRNTNSASGVALTGATGVQVSTPDHSSLDLSDIDIRVEAILDDWTSVVQTFVSKWSGGTNQQSYLFRVDATGHLRFDWSTTGADTLTRTSVDTVPFTNGQLGAVRVRSRVSSGFRRTALYTASSIDGPWTTVDGVEWATASNTIFNGSAAVEVGSFNLGGSGALTGIVRKLEIRNGTTDVTVASPDFAAQGSTVTSFVDANGRTWTIAGAAAIIGQPPLIENWGRRVTRFIDQSSADTFPAAQIPADTALIEGAITGGMQLYPIEKAGTLYGVDYELGDRVSAVIAGIELVEPVRRVVIEHEAGNPPNIVPTIGLAEGDGEFPEDAPLIRTMLRNLASSIRR